MLNVFTHNGICTYAFYARNQVHFELKRRMCGVCVCVCVCLGVEASMHCAEKPHRELQLHLRICNNTALLCLVAAARDSASSLKSGTRNMHINTHTHTHSEHTYTQTPANR